jgi:DNA-binding CsgD family transcriptional regulator
MDPSYQRSYEEYYKAKNIYLLRGNRLLQTGNVHPSHILCPNETALRTEFHNDWVAPQKQRYGMLGVIFREQSVSSIVGAIRSTRAAPFGEREISLVRTLIPHLQRAVRLRRRIASLESQKGAATNALDSWSLGVILLDRAGRVILTNRAADEIVRGRDGLTIGTDGLQAALAGETAELRRLIHGAVGRTPSGSLPGALTLSRPSFKRPLSLLVTPACDHGILVPEQGAVSIVFVSDPEVHDATNEQALERLYRLTPAEAIFLALLVRETDLKHVSEILRISRNTARTHLKRIFEKTGTKRQAELVRLVLRSPTQVRSIGR